MKNKSNRCNTSSALILVYEKEEVECISAKSMKKSRKELIETFQLITSVIALAVTLLSLLKAFMNWSDRYE